MLPTLQESPGEESDSEWEDPRVRFNAVRAQELATMSSHLSSAPHYHPYDDENIHGRPGSIDARSPESEYDFKLLGVHTDGGPPGLEEYRATGDFGGESMKMTSLKKDSSGNSADPEKRVESHVVPAQDCDTEESPATDEVQGEFPDGGLRAWLVVLGVSESCGSY